MCFYNDDYDWCASVWGEDHIRNADEVRCYECNRRILSHEWRRHSWQQEHEVCQCCEDEDSYSFDEEQEKATCKHDYGETFEASTCRECCLLLEAIYDLERIEGCPEHARQPMYGELQQVLYDERFNGAFYNYRLHALNRFPELVASRILQKCGSCCNDYEDEE